MSDHQEQAYSSNFITAPDFVESILIINATEQQIAACMAAVQSKGVPYNIYVDDANSPDPIWLAKVTRIADHVLNAKSTDLVEYFNK